MKAQEALEHAQRKLEVYKTKVENGYVFYSRALEFREIVSSAISRMVPKKPIPSTGLYKKLRGDIYSITCPTCNTGFTRDADYASCPTCGQRLDWSEGEEND